MPSHGFSPVPGEEPCCHLSKNSKIYLGILCALVLATTAVVVGVLLWRKAPELKKWDGIGTTPHFPEIVLGRCYIYTQVLRPERK